MWCAAPILPPRRHGVSRSRRGRPSRRVAWLGCFLIGNCNQFLECMEPVWMENERSSVSQIVNSLRVPSFLGIILKLYWPIDLVSFLVSHVGSVLCSFPGDLRKSKLWIWTVSNLDKGSRDFVWFWLSCDQNKIHSWRNPSETIKLEEKLLHSMAKDMDHVDFVDHLDSFCLFIMDKARCVTEW